MIRTANNWNASMEELLQFLYLTPVGVVKFAGDGVIDLINPEASSILQSLCPGNPLHDLYSPLATLLPDLRRRVQNFVADSGVIIDQQRMTAEVDGTDSVTTLSVNRVNENVYMAVLKDVTQYAHEEEALYRDQQKFRAIFDSVRDYAIYTITLEGRIEEWNHSMQRYAGWLQEDVQGRSIEVMFPPDDPARPDVTRLLREALRVGSVETEGWRRRRDGTRLWANSVITALPDERGTVRGFVVVSRDMTERKRMEDEMRAQAMIDPLTGASNRRQGEKQLAAEFSRRARDGRLFAVLMLDVDHFKDINDRFGHAAGDAVLQAMVRCCRLSLRPVDIVIRWGGEEFLLVLPDTEETAAMAAAERLRGELGTLRITAYGGTSVQFTVSIGVALSENEDPQDLLRRADDALYAAKAAGRNRVVLATKAAIAGPPPP